MLKEIRIELGKAVALVRQDGLWVLIGRSYLTFSALLASIILARLLTKEDYGTYKYINAVFALVAMLAVAEAGQILIRYVPRGFDNAYSLLLSLKRRSSFLGLAALLGVSGWNFYQEEAGLAWAFLTLAFVFLVYHPYQLFEPYLQAKRRYKELSTAYIWKATVQLLAVVLIYLATKSIIAATVGGLILIAGVHFVASQKVQARYRNAMESTSEVPKSLTAEAILLSLASALPLVVEHADKILVAKLIDYSALAIFSIGMTLGTAVNGFFKPFMASLSAKLVHKRLSPVHYLIVLAGGTAAGMVLAWLLPVITRILYGQRYIESAIYGAVVLKSMGIYFMHTLQYKENLFNKDSVIWKVYVNNITIPLLVIVYMSWIFSSARDPGAALFMLAIIYPLRLLLSSALFITMNRASSRRRGVA